MSSRGADREGDAALAFVGEPCSALIGLGVAAMGKRTAILLATVAVVVLIASVSRSALSAASTTTTTAAVATTPTTVPTSNIVASSTTDQTVGMPKAAINLAAIPLGTGKSSTGPKVGALYRCGGTPSGGPPVSIPPWVNTAAGTWDAKTKVAVQGDVTFTSSFTVTRSGASQVFTGNGLPPRAGTFPVASTDPAHAYNPDPSAITAHSINLSVPYNPKVNTTARCEMGVVGIAVNGIPILDGFDAGGNDAAGVETQDTCHGHPNDRSGYHYHSLSPCLLSNTARTHATQVGWALDGFGIYVEYNSKGQLLTNASLDGCHGRKSVVTWHGTSQSIYHYDMTFEFPFSVGCFRGTPTNFLGMMAGSTP